MSIAILRQTIVNLRHLRSRQRPKEKPLKTQSRGNLTPRVRTAPGNDGLPELAKEIPVEREIAAAKCAAIWLRHEMKSGFDTKGLLHGFGIPGRSAGGGKKRALAWIDARIPLTLGRLAKPALTALAGERG